MNGSYTTGRALLIRTRFIQSSTLFEFSLESFAIIFIIISCLKCRVNSYFHLIWRKSLPTNDFELTVPNLYSDTYPKIEKKTP